MQPVTQQPEFINRGGEGFFEFLYRFALKFFSVNWLEVMYVILTLVVITLISISLYVLVRLYEIKQEAKKKSVSAVPLDTDEEGVAILSGDMTKFKHNPLWESIRNRILSDNTSDWRVAIIEADIYMDKVLDEKGFHGDTVGDKLKQLTPDTLPSIQVAWEAHKVRNRIAHDGADFNLTLPESRRVLSYYEIVFRDLGVIE